MTTSSDPPEFDFGEGKEKAEEGMSQASGAGRIFGWQHDAGRWFMLLPVGTEFTADDLTKAVGLPDQGLNRNNVVGAFFNGLAKARFIQWTGKTYKSERVDRHTGMNRVWLKIK
jgi:hypothetical protein